MCYLDHAQGKWNEHRPVRTWGIVYGTESLPSEDSHLWCGPPRKGKNHTGCGGVQGRTGCGARHVTLQSFTV
jgi:hypothetical protein